MTKLSQLSKLALIFLVATGTALPGYAVNEQSIGQFEQKFFFHNYARDTVEDRLSRLERMVFGSERSGTPDQRLSMFSSALNTAGGATIAAGSKSQPKPTPAPTSPPVIAADDGDDAPPPPRSSNYPAIAAIERKILGQSFAGDAAMKRVERLEKSVFGRASSGLLVDRVDRLKQRTGIDVAMQDPNAKQWQDDNDADEPAAPAVISDDEQQGAQNGVWDTPPTPFAKPSPRRSPAAPAPVAMPKKTAAAARKPSPTVAYPPAAPALIAQSNVPPPAPPSFQNNGWGDPEAAPSLGVVRQLSALEYQMFGRIYSDGLTTRIARLESAVFPMQNTSRSQPLSQRINRLLRAVQAAAPAVPLAQGRMRRPTVPHNQPLFNVP